MRLLIAGGYDTQNLGDYAMLYVLKENLGKLGDVKIVLLSRHPEVQIDDFIDILQIKNLDFNTKKESLGKWFRGFNVGDDTSHLHHIYKNLVKSDALIIGGGRLLIDITLDFMRGPLYYYFLLIILAKFINKPIIIYAMTIVKPMTQTGVLFLKFIIENSNLVIVREKQSMENLKELKIDTANVYVCPDPAFALPSVGKDVGEKVFFRENIRVNDCIGVNLRYLSFSQNMGFEEMVKKFAFFCDKLYEKFTMPLVFIPQMYYGIDNKYMDDRCMHKEVYNICINKSRMYVLKDKYSLLETLSLYKNIRALFSARRHGIIFAATQGIPVYSIALEDNTVYALKALELDQNNIYLTSKDGNDFFRDIRSFDETKKQVDKIVPELSEKAKKQIELIKSFLFI